MHLKKNSVAIKKWIIIVVAILLASAVSYLTLYGLLGVWKLALALYEKHDSLMFEIMCDVLVLTGTILVVRFSFKLFRYIFWRTSKYKARYTSKACPICKKRLAECEKKQLSIRLNAYMPDQKADYEYYCPYCEMRIQRLFLLPCRKHKRKIPKTSGTRYRRKHLVSHYRLLGNIPDGDLWKALGVLFASMLILLIPTVLILNPENIFASITSAILIALVFAAVQLSVSYLVWFLQAAVRKLLHRIKPTYYEVMDDGLMVVEPFNKQFYAWEDFRLISIRAGYYEGTNGYIFDLDQRVLIIDCGVEYYITLSEEIINRLKDKVSIGY